MTGKNLKQAESLACTKNRTRELAHHGYRHCTRSKVAS